MHALVYHDVDGQRNLLISVQGYNSKPSSFRENMPNRGDTDTDEVELNVVNNVLIRNSHVNLRFLHTNLELT